MLDNVSAVMYTNFRWYCYDASQLCRSGGIGRRSRLKICRWQQRAGSSPASGTIVVFKALGFSGSFFVCFFSCALYDTRVIIKRNTFICFGE